MNDTQVFAEVVAGQTTHIDKIDSQTTDLEMLGMQLTYDAGELGHS